nr:TRAP transporter small permease [Salinibacterium sp.]
MSDAMSLGAAIALVLMAVNIVIDVIGRSLFNSPFAGTLELTSFWWMPTLTLLAFAVTERHQEHIKVTLLLDSLPVRMRQIIEGSVSVLATLLLLALAWFTLANAIDAEELRLAANSTPPIPIWPFKFVAAAGIAMLAVQMAATAYRHFAGLLPRADSLATEGDVS